MGHQTGPCCHTEAAASDHNRVTRGQKLRAKEGAWEPGFPMAEMQTRTYHCPALFHALQHSEQAHAAGSKMGAGGGQRGSIKTGCADFSLKVKASLACIYTDVFNQGF